jgi:hypothetical protein
MNEMYTPQSITGHTDTTRRELDGLHLFKSLIKDGCKWEGDVMSNSWSECLIVPDDEFVEQRVQDTLEAYEEGVDYQLDGNAVWIY